LQEENYPVEEKINLKIFVSGGNLNYSRTIELLKEALSQRPGFVCDIEIIDVRKFPQKAEHARILATPTILKEALPERRIIGNLTNIESALKAVDYLIY